MKKTNSGDPKKKKQRAAMKDPEEKSKIMRVRQELHGSSTLTDVEHDNKEFEIASNDHLNAHMNKQIRIDNRAVER